MNSTPLQSLKRGMNYLGAGVSAWRMHHSRSELVRARAERHLVERLGRLRGLPQKVGQMLSMTESGSEEGSFAELRASAPPVDLETLMPVLAEGWGFDPETVIDSIEPTGLAASLGQVHRAKLLDGRTVAIKIQYPDIADAIDTDLKTLGWISAPVGNLRRGFDMEQYRSVIRAGLEEELDYSAEAGHQKEFERLTTSMDIVVPEVVEELSSDRVLTTIWQEGETLDQVADWSREERCHLGRLLVEQFLEMGFVNGLLHGDLHPGNYRFRRGQPAPEMLLYDFGCVCRLDPTDRLLLLRLIADSVNPNSTQDPFPILVGLGFDAELLEPLRHKLPAICRVLFEPFACSGQYKIEDWKVSERLEAALGSDRFNFRISGPAKLVHFLRAFTGLTHIIQKLNTPVYWSGPLQKLLARKQGELNEMVLPTVTPSNSTFAGIAKKLHILVTENGLEKVSLNLPASAVERLADLLDEDIEKRIDERGIDVDELLRGVRERLYAPQEIFSLDEGGKCFTVSLK